MHAARNISHTCHVQFRSNEGNQYIQTIILKKIKKGIATAQACEAKQNWKKKYSSHTSFNKSILKFLQQCIHTRHVSVKIECCKKTMIFQWTFQLTSQVVSADVAILNYCHNTVNGTRRESIKQNSLMAKVAIVN